LSHNAALATATKCGQRATQYCCRPLKLTRLETLIKADVSLAATEKFSLNLPLTPWSPQKIEVGI
jgi:hypothetical protein